ncbi:uncharacterized protein [Drosophila takahashii]|uniref:uncharacterized protein isoform X5 n=1 Tax=Drosophila takahashii TaxID=29030 RepID=UPI0038996997
MVHSVHKAPYLHNNPHTKGPQHRGVYRQNGFTIIDGYRFVVGTTNLRRTYLKCANFRSRCRARAIVNRETNKVRMRHEGHNHSRKDVITRS